MPAKPFTKFYWNDWRADTGLRMCSLAAHGLWMQMLCIMGTADDEGYLEIAGVPLQTVDEIANAVGRPAGEIGPLFEELKKWKVFSVDRRGIIHSRKLIREKKRSRIGKKAADKRWSNPTEKQGDLLEPNGDDDDDPNGGATGVEVEVEVEVERKKEKSAPTSRQKRARRWGDDEQVPVIWRTWAMDEEGLSKNDADREADRFADYWKAKSGADATKLDWPATWRNWIRRNRDNGRQSTAQATGSSSQTERRGRGGYAAAGLRNIRQARETH